MTTTAKASSSQETKTCLYLAKVKAFKLQHPECCTLHLVWGILQNDDGVASLILLNHGITMPIVEHFARSTIKEADTPVLTANMSRHPKVDEAIEEATTQAEVRGSDSIEPIDLLWGILATPFCEAEFMFGELRTNMTAMKTAIEQTFADGTAPCKGLLWSIKEALGDPSMPNHVAVRLAIGRIKQTSETT